MAKLPGKRCLFASASSSSSSSSCPGWTGWADHGRIPGMSRTRRNILRATAVTAVAGCLLLVATFQSVDHRPALRQSYHAETLARLQAVLATNQPHTGELDAGFGRALLTPILGASPAHPASGKFGSIPLAGYGDRKGRPASGIHDDLFVKAVALRVGGRLGIMAAADALIVPEEVCQIAVSRLAAELGLSREQVYLGATHTHASIGGWAEGPVGEAFAADFLPGVREWFADRIVEAARLALADLKPAMVGQGRFVAREFVRNRLVGDLGRVDPEFSFLVLQQQDGAKAVLGSFSAHATVLSGDVMEFSGDYPGAWQRAVERGTGGTAVFFAGGVGSHSPVPGERGFIGAERMGNTLGAMLLDELPSVAMTNQVPFALAGVDVTLPPLNWRITDGVRFRPWAADALLRAPERVFVQALRIGDIVWMSTPCDFSGELALEIKDLARARGADAVVTSFNGSYIGYVIPNRYYHLPGYEPRVMSFYGPNTTDYLDEILRKLALHVIEQ